MLKKIKKTVAATLRRAVTQKVSEDRGKVNAVVETGQDEVATDTELLCQYGFRSVPRDGARGVALAYAGEADNLSLFAVDDQRYGQAASLFEGDALMYNDAGAYTHMSADAVHTDAPGLIFQRVGDSYISISADEIVLSVGGKNYTFNATQMTSDTDVVAENISLVNHVHGGVQSGPSTTDEPQ